MKKTEYLPVLVERDGKLLVAGKTERKTAHSVPPVCHATAIIVPVFPDGRLLMEDRAERHRREGRFVPEDGHVFNCFGGHMQYADIPEEEHRTGVSMETFRKCAYRELSEELVRVTADGRRETFSPVMDRLVPVGLYSMKGEANWEYSWLFLYRLEDFGPYGSQDTVMTEHGEENVVQSACVMTWEALLEQFTNREKLDTVSFSDGIARVLLRNSGEELHCAINCIFSGNLNIAFQNCI